MAKFATQKGPGVVVLAAKSGPLTITIDPNKSAAFMLGMVEVGYTPHGARLPAAFASSTPDITALEQALAKLGDVAEPLDVIGENRGRVTGWYEGLRDCVHTYYDFDRFFDEAAGRLDKRDTGIVVSDSECRLNTVDGRQFAWRYTLKAASALSKALIRLGYPQGTATPLQVANGHVDDLVLGQLLVEGSRHSPVAGINEATIESFMAANHGQLVGWWLTIRECVQRYWREADDTTGEGVGAGMTAEA